MKLLPFIVILSACGSNYESCPNALNDLSVPSDLSVSRNNNKLKLPPIGPPEDVPLTQEDLSVPPQPDLNKPYDMSKPNDLSKPVDMYKAPPDLSKVCRHVCYQNSCNTYCD